MTTRSATYTPEPGGMFEAVVLIRHMPELVLNRELSIDCAKAVVHADGYRIRGLRTVRVANQTGEWVVTFGVRREGEA